MRLVQAAASLTRTGSGWSSKVLGWRVLMVGSVVVRIVASTLARHGGLHIGPEA
ncbi:hypothetical protein GCM10009725_32570 [Aeromicrobium tamlense]